MAAKISQIDDEEKAAKEKKAPSRTRNGEHGVDAMCKNIKN